ncbi:unnamed protein product [Phaedon cochleariae]|uniref:Neurotransmitter-gated ion-channel ligand-binding domain-containing protein n=1 Tax=Phaedon cochleariae TaxID=80249 RepID=A0A9N9X2A1_PHACE|nr:unnamed protein product [Phaedon cochleariae]
MKVEEDDDITEIDNPEVHFTAFDGDTLVLETDLSTFLITNGDQFGHLTNARSTGLLSESIPARKERRLDNFACSGRKQPHRHSRLSRQSSVGLSSERRLSVAMPSAVDTMRAWLLSALVVHQAVAGNPDAKRLYDDLLSNYNKLVRPVVNTSDVLRVCIKLKLSQLIDVSSVGLSSERRLSVAMPSAVDTLRAWLLSALVVHQAVAGNPDAKRLYDDLLSNYNKLVRPVVNTSDVLRVCIKLKLSQLIDVVRI